MGKRALGTIVFIVGIASATMGFVFFQQTGSGMLGYWKCDDTASPSKDSTGNGNDGIWSATGVAGLTGAANSPMATPWSTGCLQFSNPTAQVAVPGTPALTLTGDFTVAFWMYPDADAGDYQRLVGKGAATTPGNPGTALNRTFGIWRNPGADHRILFQQSNNGNFFLNITSSATTANTTWTHIAARISGNAATLFINGSSANGATATVSMAPGAVATDPVTFGYAGFHTSFPGRLTDIRYYNRAVSDADIAALSTGGVGPAAPTGLTATGGASSIQLTWNALPGGAVYNVQRGTVSGGPYTTIASTVATNSYTDSTAAVETTYYYVVSGVTYGEGPNSNEASALCGPVTALPNTGLQTSESGATATFDVTFNTPAPAGSTVTVTSNNTTSGGLVSSATNPAPSPSITIAVATGFTGSIPITVKGVEDFVVTPNTAYTVSVSATGFAGLAIPDVKVTNLETDTVGILLSKSALVTTTAGGQDSFAVELNSSPSPGTTVTIFLTSTNTTEGTVSPPSITFTGGVGGNWNMAQPVTVTGVGVNLTYINEPYAIDLVVQNGSDPAYFQLTNPPTGSPVVVSCLNLHLEAPPKLSGVWGKCGFLGVEVVLPILLLRWLLRRKVGIGVPPP